MGSQAGAGMGGSCPVPVVPGTHSLFGCMPTSRHTQIIRPAEQNIFSFSTLFSFGLLNKPGPGAFKAFVAFKAIKAFATQPAAVCGVSPFPLHVHLKMDAPCATTSAIGGIIGGTLL